LKGESVHHIENCNTGYFFLQKKTWANVNKTINKMDSFEGDCLRDKVRSALNSRAVEQFH